jgi:hypothetical protein
MTLYLCTRNKGQTKIQSAMKNTEYNFSTATSVNSVASLASVISSEDSFSALIEMMGDMGLEMDSAVMGD